MLLGFTGIEKSKMEPRKPDYVNLSVYTRNTTAICVFRVHLSTGTIKNVVRSNRKWELKYGGLQTRSTHISACGHDMNEIPTA